MAEEPQRFGKEQTTVAGEEVATALSRFWAGPARVRSVEKPTRLHQQEIDASMKIEVKISPEPRIDLDDVAAVGDFVTHIYSTMLQPIQSSASSRRTASSMIPP